MVTAPLACPRQHPRSDNRLQKFLALCGAGSRRACERLIAAGRVAQAIARKYAKVLPEEILAVHDAQIGWAAAQAESFQEYMRRVRDPNFVADGSWPMRTKH